ncbi:hypothetical protein HDF16_003573 [Granulicella aggregans]|uniref:Uncharacterized protein n=1 Tax=Granulicella aggregans TaxID=474949 RepID=A0A7W8E641_9BACT|nr:hypothetical protein [Granulicella aggregans]
MTLCGYISKRAWSGWEGYVPRQQFVDLADGMAGDAIKDVVKIEFRVEPVELRRDERGVNDGGSFFARIRFREEIGLPSERDDAQRAFSGVVIDLQLSVDCVAGERGPSREA